MFPRYTQFWYVLLMFSLLVSLTTGQTRAQVRATDRYIVTLHHSAVEPQVAAQILVERYHLQLWHTYAHALKGFSVSGSVFGITKLRLDPLVASVELSQSEKLAAFGETRRGNLGNQTAQVIPTGIRRIGADRNQIARIDGIDDLLDVDVAVIDSGIQQDHPDLNVAGSVVCNGGQVASQQPAIDLPGHGTAVAGVIAARDNAIGVVGVAPGARLWAVRVAHLTVDNQVRYNTDDLICAVDWVTANAHVIEVANISLGAYAPLGFEHGTCGKAANTVDAALHRAICNAVAAGVPFVVAAGELRPTMPRTDTASISPASFDEVITVSGMADFDGQGGGRGRQPLCMTNDKDDTFWDESNYGNDVDLTAPAVCITTTSASMWTGTSFAAPHVTGAAALYKIARPTASPAEVKRVLVAAAQSGWNVSRSAGRPHGDDPDNAPEPLLAVQTLPKASKAGTSYGPSTTITTGVTASAPSHQLQFKPDYLWD